MIKKFIQFLFGKKKTKKVDELQGYHESIAEVFLNKNKLNQKEKDKADETLFVGEIDLIETSKIETKPKRKPKKKKNEN